MAFHSPVLVGNASVPALIEQITCRAEQAGEGGEGGEVKEGGVKHQEREYKGRIPETKQL